MAGIPLDFVGKAPQEWFQEEEVEHGTFRAALSQASIEANARGGTMRCDNAHCGAATKGMEKLCKLLRDPHVAQEESQSPMRGGVEGLGDIKGQDMILLLSPLRCARNTKATAVEPGMAPNCQSTAMP